MHPCKFASSNLHQAVKRMLCILIASCIRKRGLAGREEAERSPLTEKGDHLPGLALAPCHTIFCGYHRKGGGGGAVPTTQVSSWILRSLQLYRITSEWSFHTNIHSGLNNRNGTVQRKPLMYVIRLSMFLDFSILSAAQVHLGMMILDKYPY